MMCSPSGLSRTASGATFPSEPGAPLGQSLIRAGCADAMPNERQINAASRHWIFLAVRKTVLLVSPSDGDLIPRRNRIAERERPVIAAGNAWNNSTHWLAGTIQGLKAHCPRLLNFA